MILSALLCFDNRRIALMINNDEGVVSPGSITGARVTSLAAIIATRNAATIIRNVGDFVTSSVIAS